MACAQRAMRSRQNKQRVSSYDGTRLMTVPSNERLQSVTGVNIWYD